jgi:hypothetical protein
MTAKQINQAVMLRFPVLVLVLLAITSLINGCSEDLSNASRVVSAQNGQLTVVDADGTDEVTHTVATDAEVVLDGEVATLDALEQGDAVKLVTAQVDGTEIVQKIEATSQETVSDDEESTEQMIDDSNATDAPIGTPPTPDAAQEDIKEQSTDAPIVVTEEVPSDEAEDMEQSEPFSGKIASLGENQFAVTREAGGDMTFAVNDNTKYTLDGNEATFADLKVDHSVNVAADQAGDNYIATMVDATSASPE